MGRIACGCRLEDRILISPDEGRILVAVDMWAEFPVALDKRAELPVALIRRQTSSGSR